MIVEAMGGEFVSDHSKSRKNLANASSVWHFNQQDNKMEHSAIPDLIRQYREAAINQVRQTKENPQEANRLYDVVQDLFGKLRDLEAYDALVSLLDDPEPGVRLAASSHCSPYVPEKVRTTLAELAQNKDFAIAISAQMALNGMARA